MSNTTYYTLNLAVILTGLLITYVVMGHEAFVNPWGSTEPCVLYLTCQEC